MAVIHIAASTGGIVPPVPVRPRSINHCPSTLLMDEFISPSPNSFTHFSGISSNPAAPKYLCTGVGMRVEVSGLMLCSCCRRMDPLSEIGNIQKYSIQILWEISVILPQILIYHLYLLICLLFARILLYCFSHKKYALRILVDALDDSVFSNETCRIWFSPFENDFYLLNDWIQK